MCVIDLLASVAMLPLPFGPSHLNFRAFAKLGPIILHALFDSIASRAVALLPFVIHLLTFRELAALNWTALCVRRSASIASLAISLLSHSHFPPPSRTSNFRTARNSPT